MGGMEGGSECACNAHWSPEGRRRTSLTAHSFVTDHKHTLLPPFACALSVRASSKLAKTFGTMVTAGDEHDDSSVDLRSTKRSRNDGQVTSAQQHMPHDSDEEESRHEDGLENNVKPFDADDDSDDDAGDDDHGDPIDDDETAALKADLGDDVREGKRVRRTGADQSSTGPS